MQNNTPPLKLDFNERSDGSPEWVKQKLAQNSELPLWLYPDRSVLEKSIARFNNLSTEQVLATNGADEAIQLILLACKFGYLNIDQVLLPTPTFSMYEKGLQQWQLNFTIIKPNVDFCINQQQITDDFQQMPRSLLILVRPNNPTGEQVSSEFLQQLLTFAEINNSLIVIDEAYSDFAGDNCTSLLRNSKQVILLRTFSKAYGLAGIRTGYILAAETIIGILAGIAMPFNVSTLSLTLAGSCFEKTAQQDLSRYVDKIKQNREVLQNLLQQLTINISDSQGNFIFFTLKNKRYQLFVNYCQQQNIQIRTFNDPLLKNSIRLTIPFNIERLEKLFRLVFKPDLICLDMDGTLIDVSQSYDAAIKATVNYFSNEDVNQADIEQLRASGGFNNDWVLSQQLLQQSGMEVTLANVTEKFQQFYLGTTETGGLIENEKILVSQQTLEQLQNTTLAIVTGRPGAEAKMGCDRLELNCEVISIDDVANGKPDAESILKARNITRTENCWMVGDNVDDMQAAINAQALAIGINSSGSLEYEKILYEAGATLVINDINDVEILL